MKLLYSCWLGILPYIVPTPAFHPASPAHGLSSPSPLLSLSRGRQHQQQQQRHPFRRRHTHAHAWRQDAEMPQEPPELDASVDDLSTSASRRDALQLQLGASAVLPAAAAVLGSPLRASADEEPTAGNGVGGMGFEVPKGTDKPWLQIKIDSRETLFDIDFDASNPRHGLLVGAKGTIFETLDGGQTWNPKSLAVLDPEEEVSYRFQQVSFKDGEAWIIGQPPILLHTTDGAKTWQRIRLSPKLPGAPYGIYTLGPNSAEMTTSSGAIYTTNNGGLNWKAQVKETIDATLNRISSSGVSGASYYTGSIINQQRDASGTYLAVGSRGNFWLSYKPGQPYWTPHNRGSNRRIQNMGFIDGDLNKGVWMSLNGGGLQVARDANFEVDVPTFERVNIKTGGYGIIDVSWKGNDEVWAVGGSGTMYVSTDGGKSFKFNNAADGIPGNLYRVKFFDNKQGFVLGSDGVLLRYTGRNIKA
ncbi:unnamed protein product [Vitrella brassicaformis CCMP3155]|uniref:Photosynthesis system II assembly factor Ycf48/Hcf136-like domain-containing protein n=2 Tax=Vitrella brassicaformis TaxID=1169539 RepID=A0A0G4FE81_VITBC|nr:unnamed protein product [Vitrella brassicaformis CCMP3155]|eukprot:CEM11483.1 unnamed protein product [Vitrella brassicaformis CCMP3155]